MSVSLVELKSRMPHASEIAEKLTNGGKRAKSILEQEGLRVGKVTAVILARRFHRQDYAILKDTPVVIDGRKHWAFARPCGTGLKDIRRPGRPA